MDTAAKIKLKTFSAFYRYERAMSSAPGLPLVQVLLPWFLYYYFFIVFLEDQIRHLSLCSVF